MGVPSTTVCSACGAPNAGRPDACAWCGARIAPPVAPAAVAVSPARRAQGAEALARTYCPHCGRLYPATARACPTCLPLATEEKGGTCPRCARDLSPPAVGTASPPAAVDRCDGCGGTWFDVGEVERAADLRTHGGLPRERLAGIRRALAGAAEPRGGGASVACVRCGGRTARRLVAAGSGILVDLCGPHGIWFDGEEFERFRAFAAAGGLEIVRHWEEEVGRPRGARPGRWRRLRTFDRSVGVPGALSWGLLSVLLER